MKLRKWLSGVLVLVMTVSSLLLVRNVLDMRAGDEAYSEAKTLARTAGPSEETVPAQTEPATMPDLPEMVWVPELLSEPDPVMEELAETDISALRQTNPDVLGWIRIPDSKIDYPLLQGEDNDFYLDNNWQGTRSQMGSVFMEYQSSPDFTDYNTLIYGHNMTNGSMFSGLHKYQYAGYWETHPYVYILTDDGTLRYEVFSTYTAEVGSDTYRIRFSGAEEKADFLAMALEYSDIDTGIVPDPMDRILTLSTCSGLGYTNRRVVHARLKMVQVTSQ